MLVCSKCNAEIAPSLTTCPFCGTVLTDFLRRYAGQPLDGKYEILSVLGIGGMGEVYKARHIHLGTLRVIKLMRPHIAAVRDAHERFLREARLATRIQHPNVAALHDFSALPDGSFYMVWEYIDGVTLQKFVADRQFLRPADAVHLACPALLGLEAIHRAGIVHRDISPENMMVTRDDLGNERIKIIDLGVAKQWNDPAEDQTRTGIFVGKFKYCSPEQLGMLKEGERIDGRADIYSFGLVLYEMLTGVPPFQAETPHQYVLLHSSKMPLPLRQTNPQAIVPPQLEALIFRALQKNRERRFDTALLFEKALEAALPSLPAYAYSSTVTVSLPEAQSVSDIQVPSIDDATVVHKTPDRKTTISQATPIPESDVSELGEKRVAPASQAPKAPATASSQRPDDTASRWVARSGVADTSASRKRDLFEQVVAAMGEEQYAKADVAFQTLKMHLGVRAETDTEFKRLRKELEAAAADKEAWFVDAIDEAKQQGNAKQVLALINERDEKLGRRFGDSTLKAEVEVWLRTRSELLAKARNWIAAESFNNAGHLLDELATHLERGAACDAEYLALQQGYQQALMEAEDKMRQEIAAAHALENIAKTRRLLVAYDAKFGRRTRKHPSVDAAEEWIRKMEALRGTPDAKQRAEPLQRSRRVRPSLIVMLLIVAIVSGAMFAAFHWKSRTAELIRQSSSGDTQALLLDILQVPPPPKLAPAQKATPPHLDDAKKATVGQTWLNPIDGLEYAWIPGGALAMGCAGGDTLCQPDERSHSVAVNGFWLSRTEVTVEAFSRFVRAAQYRGATAPAAHPDPAIDGHDGVDWREPLPGQRAQPKWPVARITSKDAAAYCAWAGGRLPAESEWEYAARAREAKTIHSWGNAAVPPQRMANLADEGMMRAFGVPARMRKNLFSDYFDGFDTYAAVGSFSPNAVGLFDLEGNVWEWCSDGNSGPVLRGGSWASAARDVRISARAKTASGASSATTGCRCVIAP